MHRKVIVTSKLQTVALPRSNGHWTRQRLTKLVASLAKSGELSGRARMIAAEMGILANH